MKRKSVWATLLSLAVVVIFAVAAALGIGAAPALAADGCTCHTAVPPTGGAPAPHAPYVVSVTDCTVCHVSWTGQPHPAVATGLRLKLSGRSIDTGYRLSGRLGLRFVDKMGGVLFLGHPGVAVYLQQRLWGATEWTDLTQVTTASSPLVPGSFTFTVAAPAPFATYRAVAQGHLVTSSGGGGLFMPTRKTLLPKPELNVEIRGFMTGAWGEAPTTKLGRSFTVRGSVAPADLGGKVTIRVQRRVQQRWVKHVTVKRAISATGTYGWKWTPSRRGTYRVFVAIPATDVHRGVVVRWRGVAYWRTFAVL